MSLQPITLEERFRRPLLDLAASLRSRRTPVAMALAQNLEAEIAAIPTRAADLAKDADGHPFTVNGRTLHWNRANAECALTLLLLLKLQKKASTTLSQHPTLQDLLPLPVLTPARLAALS